MSSLKQIAAAAGVSAATASRALRGHPNVTPGTAAAVRKAARRLKYKPNPRISSLMSYVRSSAETNFRETLAFIWPDADVREVRGSYQLSRFESGAGDRARKLGYGLDVFNHNYEEGRDWRNLERILRARNIRGLIWGPVCHSSHAHLTMPLDTHASAAIGEGFVYPRLSHTRFDHFVGMRTALHQIKRRGFRRIGFALDLARNVRATPILLASFAMAGPRGGARPKELCFQAEKLTRDNMLAWMKKARPDAVLLSQDIDELATLPTQAGISWPVKIFSLHRTQEETLFPGIDQRHDLIASHACDLVLEQLNRNEFGVPVHSKIVLVEGEWQDLGPQRRP
jgi:LacI family transcriptional regulator